MLGGLLKAAMGPILDGILRLIPDSGARAEAKEQFESQMVIAMTGLVQGQLDINMKEAQHGSIFVAGWRPFIGWVCGSALVWNFIIRPIATWIAFLSGVDLEGMPELDAAELSSILIGMLGLGGLRTYEKRLGVARTELK